MRWSLKIAKVAGIKIYMHWTFIFLIVWVMVAGIRTQASFLDTLYPVAFVLSVFLCVVLHELGHALVAKHYKYQTRDIILLPIGGLARMDELPENPKQEFLIAVMGPAVNFVIAAALWPIIYWFGMVPNFLTIVFQPKSSTYFFDLFVVNLAIGAFNLLPAFPMDGGRIFRALLTLKISRVKATNIAARTGQFIAILFFFTGIFFNPMLSFIGVFIFLMAQVETEYVTSRSILHDYKVKDVAMHKYYALDSFAPITDAVNLLMDVQAHDFLVTERGYVVGTLNGHNIIKTLATKGNTALVLDAMKPDVKYLAADAPLDKAYAELQANNKSIMPVMEKGQIIGIVNLEHILDLIMVKEASHNFSGTKEEYEKKPGADKLKAA